MLEQLLNTVNYILIAFQDWETEMVALEKVVCFSFLCLLGGILQITPITIYLLEFRAERFI